MFSDVNVSQGSVATYARNGGIFNKSLYCKFTTESSSEKKIRKSAKVWQNYGREFLASLLWQNFTTEAVKIQPISLFSARLSVSLSLPSSLCSASYVAVSMALLAFAADRHAAVDVDRKAAIDRRHKHAV